MSLVSYVLLLFVYLVSYFVRSLFISSGSSVLHKLISSLFLSLCVSFVRYFFRGVFLAWFISFYIYIHIYIYVFSLCVLCFSLYLPLYLFRVVCASFLYSSVMYVFLQFVISRCVCIY